MIAWSDTPNEWPLGDGRYASAADHPATVDELRHAVVSRVEQGLAIYPQGGRTALDYGGMPSSPGARIDLSGLNRVVDYPAADMTITVEPGITRSALAEVLASENQRLVLDVPHADRATLGGIYATNFSGSRRFGGGRPRDHIIGVKFVTADGQEIKGGGRVVKNVAGYDFPKLLTGSLGSLGVISQLTLKVRPRPEATALAWIGFDDPASADAALTLLNTSATRPISVDLLNLAAARAIGEPLGLAASPWTIIVGLEDNEASVAWQCERLHAEHAAGHVEIRRQDEAAPLWSALTEFADRAPGPLSVVASVRPTSVARLLDRLDAGRWSALAHAGNGIVRAHAIGDWSFEQAATAVASLRDEARAGGGSVVLAKCPSAWKMQQLQVWGERRADWVLAEGIKRALDPRGVMNPGRFVGTI